MKVCVLQPSYEKSEMLKGHAQLDPPRELAHLVPEWSFTNVFLHKVSVYSQIKQLTREGFDIFVNLCEGHLEWDIPSIDVIHTLEMLDLPFTGPTSRLYEPRKDSLKIISRYAEVSTPPHVLVRKPADIERAASILHFPLFVKPNEGGDSFGIDDKSLCWDAAALRLKATALLQQFDAILIEEYIGGREFSVLVAADPSTPGRARAFRPVEFHFPEGEKFKTYELKNQQYHPGSNRFVDDLELEAELRHAAQKVFENYSGLGYCRMDFRKDGEGPLHVIDANFTCSVFYAEGYFGTADYILQRDGFGAANFLRLIVAEGMARHRRAHAAYRLRTEGVAGLGIEAARELQPGEIVFKGEEMSQRIASRRWVEEHWSKAEREVFAQYAYPIDDEVYILWSNDAFEWAPTNHSCSPNTVYDGLNIIALRHIAIGEEITLDYAGFLNESSASFECRCGSSNCRGRISGTPGNTILARELRRKMACIAAK